jgi:hypothetical protein
MIQRRVLVSKKSLPTAEPSPPVRRILKGKPLIAIPPIPSPYTLLTPAMEAFEAIRLYCSTNGLSIQQSDITWYHAELKREQSEMDAFWEHCAVTKAGFDSFARGDDEWTAALALNAAKQKVKAMPIQDSDIGPMPPIKSKEFWAWCALRKKLRLQKEAAIIAAGGVVKKRATRKGKNPPQSSG